MVIPLLSVQPVSAWYGHNSMGTAVPEDMKGGLKSVGLGSTDHFRGDRKSVINIWAQQLKLPGFLRRIVQSISISVL